MSQEGNWARGLRFLPLEESHAGDLSPIWSDADVIRFTGIREPCTPQEIDERIRLLKPFDVFVVRRDKEIIGIAGCPCVNQAKVYYGLFYQFRKSSWGQGYATKTVGWLLRFMKEKYAGISFFADVVAGNAASEKILQRFGFEHVGGADRFERDGVKREVRSYRLKA